MVIILNKDNLKGEEYARKHAQEVIKTIKMLKNSAFHDTVSYETFDNLIKKHAFEYFNREGECMNKEDMDKAFTILGYLYTAGLSKSDEFRTFITREQENYPEFAIPEKCNDWKYCVDSLDERQLRQIGRMAFFNMFHKCNPRPEINLERIVHAKEGDKPDKPKGGGEGISYIMRRIMEKYSPHGIPD